MNTPQAFFPAEEPQLFLRSMLFHDTLEQIKQGTLYSLDWGEYERTYGTYVRIRWTPATKTKPGKWLLYMVYPIADFPFYLEIQEKEFGKDDIEGLRLGVTEYLKEAAVTIARYNELQEQPSLECHYYYQHREPAVLDAEVVKTYAYRGRAQAQRVRFVQQERREKAMRANKHLITPITMGEF